MSRTLRHLLVPSLLALVASTAACEIISTVNRSAIGGTSGTGGAGGVGDTSTAAATTTGDMATGSGGSGGGTATTTSGGTGGATSGTGMGGAGGGGGATSSSVGSSSVASSSTGGGCTVAANDCPAPPTCVTAICLAGACSTTFVAGGTPAGPQTAGDCKQNVCNGAGALTSIDDNNDHSGDGEACTNDTCVAGVPSHPPFAGGTDCAAEGPAPKHLCGTIGSAAAGKCVECNSAADCASMVCLTNVCQGATCNDGVKNGAETGIDCGGAACPACGAPTCFDGVKNGNETDIDCGGTCAANCGINQGCFGDFDCVSNDCAVSGCIPAPHCTNAVVDGGETDLNCGGQTCTSCAVGLKCLVNTDCLSKSCNTVVSPHVCN